MTNPAHLIRRTKLGTRRYRSRVFRQSLASLEALEFENDEAAFAMSRYEVNFMMNLLSFEKMKESELYLYLEGISYHELPADGGEFYYEAHLRMSRADVDLLKRLLSKHVTINMERAAKNESFTKEDQSSLASRAHRQRFDPFHDL